MKWIYFTIIIILLILPAFQKRFSIIKEQPLYGSIKETAKTDQKDFKWAKWFDGSFQDEINQKSELEIGFRNTLIRINNQIDFSLFRKSNAENVIVGKQNELFEENYILEETGKYFVGDTIWQNKASRLKAVQDTLIKLGKSFTVIFEPGKGSLYPEKWPEKFQNITMNRSNYSVFSEYLISEKVNLLDLNKYFISIKDKSRFPIFPQCGTHWNYYGAAIAADTTIKYLEKLTHTDLAELQIVDRPLPQKDRHPDYDIGLTMNLLVDIPHKVSPDPEIRFSSKPLSLKVLIVGDSFYFNWLNNNIPGSVFKTCDFWYYNKNITRCDGSSGGNVDKLNLKETIRNYDVIIIMATGCLMHAFAWNFDEELYDLFFPGYRDPVEHFSNQIRIYGDEFQRMYNESLAMNISLPDRINQEANYLLYADSKNNPDKYTSKRDLIRIYEMGIRNTPEWMEEIKRKALKNTISIDEQVKADAEWIYKDKYEKNK